MEKFLVCPSSLGYFCIFLSEESSLGPRSSLARVVLGVQLVNRGREAKKGSLWRNIFFAGKAIFFGCLS